MSKSDVFHLGLTKNDLQGATLAIVPGDPDRVEKIAALMDKPVKLASHREFTTGVQSWMVNLLSSALPVSAARLPLLLLKSWHSWAFAPSCVSVQRALFSRILMWVMSRVTTASVRLDGASLHFAPLEFPAVADFECTTALVEAAKSIGATTHVGVTASSDTFYPVRNVTILTLVA